MKLNPGAIFRRLRGGGGESGRKAGAARILGVGAFLFFLIKGLVWLGLAAGAIWSASKIG